MNIDLFYKIKKDEISLPLGGGKFTLRVLKYAK